MLVEMDGFETNSGVIVIAATNRSDVLDRALLRPGRFDRQVHVGLPDIRGREQILRVHMRKVPINSDVDPAVLARGTPGFSGADLANLVNEAALFAARRSKRAVDMQDFEDAKDKIYMGPERGRTDSVLDLKFFLPFFMACSTQLRWVKRELPLALFTPMRHIHTFALSGLIPSIRATSSFVIHSELGLLMLGDASSSDCLCFLQQEKDRPE